MRLDIDDEVASLQQMTTGELHERYTEVFGEQTRSRHKRYLIRRIAWRLQANAEGDLSERARRRAEELAIDADVRTTPPRGEFKRQRSKVSVSTDPRLPAPGTAIVRQYKGRTLRVLVLANCLEFEGQRYKSLSAVAKAVSGSHCNGFRFFKLGDAQ
jgi:hypothetical protein